MKDAGLPASLSFKRRSEWRDWLLQHHQTETSAWVVITKKKANVTGILYEDAVEESVCFGWIDNKMRSVDDTTYILNFTPRRKDSIWSALNRQRAEKMIAAGKMVDAGLASIENAKKAGTWVTAYSAKVRPAMLDDLKLELQHEPAILERFESLPNSRQLQYITWVMQAKTGPTRAKRIKEVVSRVRSSKKAGDHAE
nr:YdeI/OmpD-associated family protein [Candidatus Sigynarchaeota archaeon]